MKFKDKKEEFGFTSKKWDILSTINIIKIHVYIYIFIIRSRKIFFF